MVRNNKIDRVLTESFPKTLVISQIPNRWRAFEQRLAISDRTRSKIQIVRTSFRRYVQTFLFRAPDQRRRKLRRKVNDVNPRFEFTRQADEHLDRSCFRVRWPRPLPRRVFPRIGFREFPAGLLDRARQFRMDQQRNIHGRKMRQCCSQVGLRCIFKFRHARWHQEAFESEYTRAAQGSKLAGISGYDSAPEANIDPAFSRSPPRA